MGELQQRHSGDQPLFPSTGGRAGQEAQRSRSADLNDFRQELEMLKELRPGSCGTGEHQPRHPEGGGGNSPLGARQRITLMTATPDVGSRLSTSRASSHVLGDRPSLPQEQSLRRSAHNRYACHKCTAPSYLSTDTINLLRKEIGLQIPAGAS